MSTERHHCVKLDSALADDDVPIDYLPVFREVSLRIVDGGTARLNLSHCPFCGTELDGSLRDEWFDQLEALDLDPESPDVPVQMRSDAWWRDRLHPHE